jgi:hypothetical protein
MANFGPFVFGSAFLIAADPHTGPMPARSSGHTTAPRESELPGMFSR